MDDLLLSFRLYFFLRPFDHEESRTCPSSSAAFDVPCPSDWASENLSGRLEQVALGHAVGSVIGHQFAPLINPELTVIPLRVAGENPDIKNSQTKGVDNCLAKTVCDC